MSGDNDRDLFVDPQRMEVFIEAMTPPSPPSLRGLEQEALADQVPIIRPQTSKTGGGRAVPLRGSTMLAPHLCVIPRNWHRRWRRLRQQAGFTHWVPDRCRHTFASYHASHFRNLPALQLEMGHSDLHLLRSRYMRPVSAGDARQFWARAMQA